jgi:hypothetical protein
MDERRERRWPWIEGAVFALLPLVVLVVGGEAVRASYHGYLHAAVGEAVLRDGLVPENPYHAGSVLRYYTLYPLLGALLGRSGIGPLWSFVALNVLAALLIAPALDALGRSLGLSFRARRAAFLAAVLGFNGLGWIGLALEGGPGLGTVPVFALRNLTFAEHDWGWDARLQAFLPKYLNVSSFALALPFGLWAMAATFAVDGRARSAWRALLPAAAALALNPIVGGFAGLCMAPWLAPTFVRGSMRTRLAWVCAGALAVALATPFALASLEPGAQGPSLTGEPNVGGNRWSNLVGPLHVLAPLGIFGWLALERAARWRLAVAVVLAAVLVLVGEMPFGNEYKLARLGGLLWALAAGVCVDRVLACGGLARAVLALLALGCVPTTAAVPWAYVRWGRATEPLPLRVAAGRLAPDRTRIAPPLPAEILAAEARANATAVLVLHPRQPGSRLSPSVMQGNALAPALHRALVVDLPQIHNDRLPDLGERLDCVQALWTGKRWAREEPYDPGQALARLRELVPGRALLFLSPLAAAETVRVVERAGARELARQGDYALLLLP